MNKIVDEGKPYETSRDTSVRPIGQVILDTLGTITKWRRFLAWTVVTSVTVAVVVTLLLPKWYKATASVFPAEQADLFGGMEGLSSIVKTFGGGGRLASLTRNTETDRYLAILQSESALLRVIDSFQLTSVYGISSYPREKTIKELLSNTQFEVTDEGALSISVFDEDPRRSADIANYFVDVLNDINSQLHVQNAKGNRDFIEQRYDKNLADIREAEDRLKAFQIKHGVIAMPEQVEASIKAGAELDARLASKEIELSVLKRTLSPTHPSIEATQIEIDETRKKLTSMNSLDPSNDGQLKLLIPLRQAPELGSEYIRLFRDVEIQYKILQFITPLYEQAKVEEKRSTPSVVILDKASVPERKAKPKVSLYALLAFVVSLFTALFVIFTTEAIHLMRSLDPHRYDDMTQAIRSDWFGLKRSPFKWFKRHAS